MSQRELVFGHNQIRHLILAVLAQVLEVSFANFGRGSVWVILTTAPQMF